MDFAESSICVLRIPIDSRRTGLLEIWNGTESFDGSRAMENLKIPATESKRRSARAACPRSIWQCRNRWKERWR